MKKVLLALLCLPIFWHLVFNIDKIRDNISSIKQYTSNNFHAIYSSDQSAYILELRSLTSDPTKSSNKLRKRLLYNKATLTVNFVFKQLHLLSPSLYFTPANGAVKVEFVPLILAPFWFFGIYMFLKIKKLNLLIFCLIWSLIVGIIGQPNEVFLFPIACSYSLISFYGLRSIVDSKYRLTDLNYEKKFEYINKKLSIWINSKIIKGITVAVVFLYILYINLVFQWLN